MHSITLSNSFYEKITETCKWYPLVFAMNLTWHTISCGSSYSSWVECIHERQSTLPPRSTLPTREKNRCHHNIVEVHSRYTPGCATMNTMRGLLRQPNCPMHAMETSYTCHTWIVCTRFVQTPTSVIRLLWEHNTIEIYYIAL